MGTSSPPEAYVRLFFERELDGTLSAQFQLYVHHPALGWLSVPGPWCISLADRPACGDVFMATRDAKWERGAGFHGAAARSGPISWSGIMPGSCSLRDHGIINSGAPCGSGIISERCRCCTIPSRSAVGLTYSLPAVHGAADLCQPREDRSQAGRGLQFRSLLPIAGRRSSGSSCPLPSPGIVAGCVLDLQYRHLAAYIHAGAARAAARRCMIGNLIGFQFLVDRAATWRSAQALGCSAWRWCLTSLYGFIARRYRGDLRGDRK